MEEVKKVRKYESVKTAKPVIVQLGKVLFSVEQSHVKKVDGSASYKGIKLVKGYSGRYGFQKVDFNSVLELPLGLSVADWDELRDAYFKLSEGF